ncbi:RNI-like protein [Lichtheimia hyalospora FSU 10163]|nr:RNI-like protein [Lichtheimia hyalospora FSU 10163]
MTTPINNENAVDFVGRLPWDITWAIFTRLNFPERVKCTRVSKNWRTSLCEWPGMYRDVHIALRESDRDSWLKWIPDAERPIQRFSFFGNTVQMKKTFDMIRQKGHSRIHTLVIGSIWAWDTVDLSTEEQLSTLTAMLELTGHHLKTLEFRHAFFPAERVIPRVLSTCQRLQTLVCKMENIEENQQEENEEEEEQTVSPTWTPELPMPWLTELVWSAEVVLPLERVLPLCTSLHLLVMDAAECGPMNVLQRIDLLCPSLRHVHLLDTDAITHLELHDVRAPYANGPGLQSLALTHVDGLCDRDLLPLLERNHQTLELLSVIHDTPLEHYWAALAHYGAPRLSHLVLRHTGPENDLCRLLSRCPALEHVTLMQCHSGPTMDALTRLVSLRSLTIYDGAETVLDRAMCFARAPAIGLRTLHLIRSRFVTDDFLETVVRELNTELSSLDVSGCEQLTSAGLQRVIQELARSQQLRSLGLADLDCVDDQVLCTLGAIQSLHTLDISRCYRVSDHGVSALVFDGCTCLRKLVMHDCLVTHATTTRIANKLDTAFPDEASVGDT